MASVKFAQSLDGQEYKKKMRFKSLLLRIWNAFHPSESFLLGSTQLYGLVEREKRQAKTTHSLPVRTGGAERKGCSKLWSTCHGKLHACLATFEFVNSVRLFLVLVLQKQHYTWRGSNLTASPGRTRSHRRNSNPAKICRPNYTYVAHSVSYKTAHAWSSLVFAIPTITM